MSSPARALLPVLAATVWMLLASRLVVAAESQDLTLCQRAIAIAEQASGVPNQLLDAISRVETGRYDPAQGAIRAWPWTINAQGQGHFYPSKAEAVVAAMQFRALGIQSIDVGCTQINLMFHPDAFSSLEDAFDPNRNAAFAAHFLTSLFHQAGSWPHAAAAYHSQTPELGTDYQRKVLQAWADPIDRQTSAPASHHSGPPWAETPRRLASLFSSPAPAPGSPGQEQNLPAPGPTAIGRPFGVPLGGLGHITRNGAGALSGLTGRTLSAYRAMPVALLTTRPPPLRD